MYLTDVRVSLGGVEWNVRNGSAAAPHHHISSRAAIGGEADPQHTNLDSEILTSAFCHKRSFVVVLQRLSSLADEERSDESVKRSVLLDILK